MKNRAHFCQARQYGQQMICSACGLNWDISDPEPPTCMLRDARTRRAQETPKFEQAAIAKQAPGLRLKIGPALGDEIAAEMDRAYQANGAGRRGMRAAYRVLLDKAGE